MIQSGFNKFFWGLLFILFSFRIQGIDILPDIIGYILFAIGFQTLAEQSHYFVKVRSFNLVMIIVSLFSIYEQPVHNEGVHINPVSTIVGLISIVLNLVIIYHLMMGIRDMAHKRQRSDIDREASQKWTYFLTFQIIVLSTYILIFIPPLFVIVVIGLFIASIVLMIVLMQFMKFCGEQFEG